MSSKQDDELVFELSESKNRIERELGAPVLHLSLPHGVQDRRVYHLARELGYETVSTSEVGYHHEGAIGPLIKRIAIGDNVSDVRFRGIVERKQLAILGMILLKAGKNLLRRVIGVARYRGFTIASTAFDEQGGARGNGSVAAHDEKD